MASNTDLNWLARMAGVYLEESSTGKSSIITIKLSTVGLDSQPKSIIDTFAKKAAASVKTCVVTYRRDAVSLIFSSTSNIAPDQKEKIRKHLEVYLSNPRNLDESMMDPGADAGMDASGEFDGDQPDQVDAGEQPNEIDQQLKQLAAEQLGFGEDPEVGDEPIQLTPAQILATLRAAYDMGAASTDSVAPPEGEDGEAVPPVLPM